MTGYKEGHSQVWLPPPLPKYPMSWLFVACVHCTAHDRTYIKSASISWHKWSFLNFKLIVGQLHLMKAQGGLILRNGCHSWSLQTVATCSFLGFSFVDIGSKSLMGVSPSDFAKQVLSMLLPVFLLNRTFELHLIFYSKNVLFEQSPQP